MTITANFPAINPALLLDFASTRALDPRVSFSRPTTATYYDNHTTVVAEQNLILQSQGMDNASWTKTNITAVTGVTAPDGTSTAFTITATSTTTTASLVQSITSAVGATYSVYAKAGTSTFVGVGVYSSPSWANFNLSTGAVASSSGCTASIVSVGSGWYRCIIANCTYAVPNLTIVGKNADPAAEPYGNGNMTSGNTIFIWGAQLEQRSSVTAYTPTTTTAITNYIPVLLTGQSNEARFDHNPTTRESLGLLIEEQRTNLLTYSADFSNAAWVKSQATITATANIAPDGTQTASKLVEDTATAAHACRQNITVSSGASYTFSVYAKAGERSQIQIQYFDGTTNKFPTFSLIDGTKQVDGGIGTNWTSTNAGNGWWRFTISVTSAGTTAQCYLYPASSGNNSYTGNGYSGIFLWGAQLE